METTPIANYDDRNASIEVTLRTLWAWLKDDNNERLSTIKEAVLDFDDRPQKHTTVPTWLIPGQPSYHRGILLTHIIMSASLYGWHPSGLADTTTLRKHVIDMLTETQEHVSGLSQTETLTYITKRIECICELAYTFLLFQRANFQPTEDNTVLIFVTQLAHHIAEMCQQDDRPKFIPADDSANRMTADKKAHCLVTALQLLSTTPPSTGIKDPRIQPTHVYDVPPKWDGKSTKTKRMPPPEPRHALPPSPPAPVPPRRGTIRPRKEPDPRRIGTRTSADNFEGCEWGKEGGPECLRGYRYHEIDNDHAPPHT